MQFNIFETDISIITKITREAENILNSKDQSVFQCPFFKACCFPTFQKIEINSYDYRECFFSQKLVHACRNIVRKGDITYKKKWILLNQCPIVLRSKCVICEKGLQTNKDIDWVSLKALADDKFS